MPHCGVLPQGGDELSRIMKRGYNMAIKKNVITAGACLLLVGASLAFQGCGRKKRTIAGVVAGAGAGALTGGLAGGGTGALIGAPVGAVVGGVVGHSTGKSKKK